MLGVDRAGGAAVKTSRQPKETEGAVVDDGCSGPAVRDKVNSETNRLSGNVTTTESLTTYRFREPNAPRATTTTGLVRSNVRVHFRRQSDEDVPAAKGALQQLANRFADLSQDDVSDEGEVSEVDTPSQSNTGLVTFLKRWTLHSSPRAKPDLKLTECEVKRELFQTAFDSLVSPGSPRKKMWDRYHSVTSQLQHTLDYESSEGDEEESFCAELEKSDFDLSARSFATRTAMSTTTDSEVSTSRGSYTSDTSNRTAVGSGDSTGGNNSPRVTLVNSQLPPLLLRRTLSTGSLSSRRSTADVGSEAPLRRAYSADPSPLSPIRRLAQTHAAEAARKLHVSVPKRNPAKAKTRQQYEAPWLVRSFF